MQTIKDKLIYSNFDYLEFKLNNDFILNKINWLVVNSPELRFKQNDFYLKLEWDYYWFKAYSLWYKFDKIANLNYNKDTNKQKNKTWLYIHFASTPIRIHWIPFIEFVLTEILQQKEFILFHFDFCFDFKDIDTETILKNLVFLPVSESNKQVTNRTLGLTYDYKTYSEHSLRIYNKLLDISDKNIIWYDHYKQYNEVTRVEFKILRKQLKRHNLNFDNYTEVLTMISIKKLNKHFNLDYQTTNYNTRVSTKQHLQQTLISQLNNDFKQFKALFETLKSTHYKKNIFFMFNSHFDKDFTKLTQYD